ncbi:hypothetical protein ELG77_09050 [Rhizobium leguminosarum]|jgi:hypothetical protein|uniref:hypothetical protein n=1 Tax=Rhizobium TaxID=379 RepID=UPI00037E3A35|nr:MULTISPECIES: hypothetical protein [Rhizobium]NEJ15523.1 hypothetical protein [Rhizobium ruizarguesonis]NEK29598.1 hypothetical protein [Rhizobium ruizarguesonis]TBG37169.1 hypothetical protein ELG78_09320 [Rhizobium leguminosarum]TBG41907.1 hypothetical protein ELG77_09050 [Rhizobium leguminosarum]
MPDNVFLFLIHYANEIWMAFLGMVGGSVRIAVGVSKGENMPPSQMFAILVTGAVLAGTSSKLFTGWLGLGPEATSFCSFIVGIMGMNIVTHAIDTDLVSTIFKKKA